MFIQPLGAIVDTSAQPSFVQNVITAYAQLEQVKLQNKLAQINLQRLQAGQQPISYDQAQVLVPTVNVQADVAPETKKQMTTIALAIAGAATLALFMRRR